MIIKRNEFDNSIFKGELHRVDGDVLIMYQILLPRHELYCCALYYNKQKCKFEKLGNATYNQQCLADELERRISNYQFDQMMGWSTFKITGVN